MGASSVDLIREPCNSFIYRFLVELVFIQIAMAVQGQRITANCKIIWGNEYEYDLDVDTDDHIYYYCLVKKDYGDRLGPLLTMTGLCRSSDAAWTELDRMLGSWAMQVQRGTPKTKDENKEILGGSRAEHKNVLSQSMDFQEMLKVANAKPA